MLLLPPTRLRGAVALLALLGPGAVAGQTAPAVRPFVAVGLEPLLTSDHPPRMPASARGHAPGLTLAVGTGRHAPGSSWGWEVRASGIWRSNSPDIVCAANIVGDCNYSSTYTAYGVVGRARYRLRPASPVRPYLLAGLGLFAAKESYPLPTVCAPPPGTCRIPRASQTVWTPAAAATFGIDMGRGRPHAFVEMEWLQFLRGQRIQTLLPLQVGLRL